MPISERTLERLILYRRILVSMQAAGKTTVFSHEMAGRTGFTAAQVRRDLMSVGHSGSPARGYHVEELNEAVGRLIDSPETEPVALVGVGHIGRAILDYMAGRNRTLFIAAAFDNDPAKVDRVLHGCRCHHIDSLGRIAESLKIRMGIIAVPAQEAQNVAVRMVGAGIKGILNYAPVELAVPPDVYLENRDIIQAIEKVAYFARRPKP